MYNKNLSMLLVDKLLQNVKDSYFSGRFRIYHIIRWEINAEAVISIAEIHVAFFSIENISLRFFLGRYFDRANFMYPLAGPQIPQAGPQIPLAGPQPPWLALRPP